jgi:hypothetical protein
MKERKKEKNVMEENKKGAMNHAGLHTSS